MERCLIALELFEHGTVNNIYITGGLPDRDGCSLAQIYAETIQKISKEHQNTHTRKLQDDTIIIDDQSHNLSHDIGRFARLAKEQHYLTVWIATSPEQLTRTVQVFCHWNRCTVISPHKTHHTEGRKVALAEWFYQLYTRIDPGWEHPIIQWWNKKRIKAFAQSY